VALAFLTIKAKDLSYALVNSFSTFSNSTNDKKILVLLYRKSMNVESCDHQTKKEAILIQEFILQA